nr:hypothetical protein [Tanacetum cinerariifolium]
MSKNLETVKNVIKDESHFISKIVDNDLGGRCGGMMGEEAPYSEEVEVNLPSVRLVLMMDEVNGGGDDFRVSKSLLGEIPEVVISKSGGETFGDDGEVVWLSVWGDRAWYGGIVMYLEIEYGRECLAQDPFIVYL